MSAGVTQAFAASLGWAAALQLAAYAIIRVARRQQRLLMGWIAGAVVRLLGLVVYALVLVPALGVPLVAALLSLVALLFVSTLIESFLLTRVAT